MRDIVVTLIIVGALPYIIRAPWFGIIGWNWVGIMNPHRLGWGFAGSLPFAQVIGICTLVGLIFSKEKKSFPINRVTVTLIIFILWMCFTTLTALNGPDAVDGMVKMLKIQIVILLGFMLMQSRERIHWLTWTLVVSVGFYGVKGGIFTLIGGGSNMVLGPPGTFISGNTEIGLALLMMMPLMRYLQLNTKKKLVRWGLGIAMLLTGIAVLGTHSRGALLGAGVMIAAFWWKSRSKLLITGVMILAVPAFLAFMPHEWWAKMDTIQNYEQDASAMGRINAWHFAVNVATDRPFGGGFDAFTPRWFERYAPVPDDFHDAHSIYFEILGEHGFVGLALFLILMWLTWRTGSRIVRLTKGKPQFTWARDLALMSQVSLLAYWVAGAFLGLAYFDGYYLIISLLVLTRIVVERELAAVPEAVDQSQLRPATYPATGHVS
ncbi:MAG TPA: putative O-glycosylation ligase, exosortase A system-associated [Burkholderiales bacterium]|nr:putative O-glycosylation ligase, exosortase A system-associated [Burkholderiales bacterium]